LKLDGTGELRVVAERIIFGESTHTIKYTRDFVVTIKEYSLEVNAEKIK
jgi:hypothetical protein